MQIEAPTRTAWAVEIARRSLQDAMHGEPFAIYWRYYRYRWFARLVVWWINTLGAGPAYERARLLGETL